MLLDVWFQAKSSMSTQHTNCFFRVLQYVNVFNRTRAPLPHSPTFLACRHNSKRKSLGWGNICNGFYRADDSHFVFFLISIPSLCTSFKSYNADMINRTCTFVNVPSALNPDWVFGLRATNDVPGKAQGRSSINLDIRQEASGWHEIQ